MNLDPMKAVKQPNSKRYEEEYERIFRKKDEEKRKQEDKASS